MDRAIITIEAENMSFTEVDRVRQIFHALLQSQALRIKTGQVTMNFANELLMSIESRAIRWHRSSEKYEKQKEKT